MKKSIVKREHLLSDGYGIAPNYWLYDSSIRNELGILIQISSLTAGNGVCTASNEWFAEKFGLSTVTISRAISKLKSKKYIDVDYERRGAEVTKRKIRLSKVTFDGYQDRHSTVINIDKESVINIDKENSISNNKSNKSIKLSPKKGVTLPVTLLNGTPFEEKVIEYTAEKNKAFLATFKAFWDKYQGTKKPLRQAFLNDFKYENPNWVEILPKLLKGYEREIKYVGVNDDPKYRKTMKNWIKEGCYDTVYAGQEDDTELQHFGVQHPEPSKEKEIIDYYRVRYNDLSRIAKDNQRLRTKMMELSMEMDKPSAYLKIVYEFRELI